MKAKRIAGNHGDPVFTNQSLRQLQRGTSGVHPQQKIKGALGVRYVSDSFGHQDRKFAAHHRSYLSDFAPSFVYKCGAGPKGADRSVL